MRQRTTMSRLPIVSWVVFSLVSLAALSSAHASPHGQDMSGPNVLRGLVLQSQSGPASQVIDSQEALADFVSCLPDKLPSMKQPAKANPDPMRQKGFTVDFSTEVMVVVVQRDTLSAYPKYQGVETGPGGRVVKFALPQPPAEARPYNWGVYTAVILPRAGGPVTIKQTALKP